MGGWDVAAPSSISRDAEQGPTWDDVREYIAYLEGISQCGIQLRLRSQAYPCNPFGFRVELWMDGFPNRLASVGIGRNYAAGARTMAGAAYQACLVGHETLEQITDAEIATRTFVASRKPTTP